MPVATNWKEVGETLQSFATTAALVLGGLWTYFGFIRQRLSFPRLDVSLTAEEIHLPYSNLLRIQVVVRNAGSVVARPSRAELRLRQMVPLPDDTEAAVRAGYDPIPSDCTQIEWPMLVGREWRWARGELEIEPGESDLLCADLFVPNQVRVVELYFFLANSTKKRHNIGWTVTVIRHLNDGGSAHGSQEGSPATDAQTNRSLPKAAAAATDAGAAEAKAPSAAATEQNKA